MLPFDRYDGNGRKLLGKPRQGNGSARQGYGPFVFVQCGTACVYCGRDLGCSYEAWLDVSIDHVIPNSLTKIWPSDYKLWIEDLANLVICCRACNEFLNQEPSPQKEPTLQIPPSNLEAFFDLRDKIFAQKQAFALARHEKERKYYDLWRISKR